MAAMQARAVAAVRDWNARLGPSTATTRSGSLQPRRRDQGDRGRRARHAPRPVPAHRGRPLLADGDPLHRRFGRSSCAQRHRRSTRRADAARRSGGEHARRPTSDAAVGGGAGPPSVRVGTRASPGLRLRPAGPVRRRHRGRARAAHVLPAGPAGAPVTTVALEKEQVAVLAERLEELLDEVAARSPAATRRCRPRRRRPRRQRAAGAADRRGVPGRHDGAGVGRRRRARSSSRPRRRPSRRGRGAARGRRRGRRDRRRAAGPADRARAPARSPSGRSRVVAAGRPPCPLCGQPLDPEGICARGRTATAGGSRASADWPVTEPPETVLPVEDALRLLPRASWPSRAGWSTPPTPRSTAPSTLRRRRGRVRLQAGRAASARCGTSRTARWPAARSPPTRSRRPPAGGSCRRPCCGTGRSASGMLPAVDRRSTTATVGRPRRVRLRWRRAEADRPSACAG